MDKRQQLERALGTLLTPDEIEYIRVGWNAFYESPQEYEGSIVIDLVMQGLNKMNPLMRAVKTAIYEHGLPAVALPELLDWLAEGYKVGPSDEPDAFDRLDQQAEEILTEAANKIERLIGLNEELSK